jgi:uncharacterized protein (TIGR03435 family)
MEVIVKRLLLLAALPGILLSQTLEGAWQGMLAPPNQNRELRVIFKITKNGNAYQGVLYNLDQNGQLNMGAITLQGNSVKIALPGLAATYDGKLEADALTGNVTQGANVMPLALKRATAETAWEIPPPPAPAKLLPEGTKLEFEVATIKPTPEGQQGQGINVNGNLFRTRNTNIVDLFTLAYNIHEKQLEGLPGWARSEHFDIQAPLPEGGSPSEAQLRMMIRNLLRDRFGLGYHTEKRELSVYAIGQGKNGLTSNIVKNESNGTLPGFGSQGVGKLGVRNATMGDLAFFLQFRVLDRPVVDQTGLAGRYDFTIDWKPDEFQFTSASVGQRPVIAADDPRPDLMTAMREQLGLKLEATKAPADVYVIDKVSRPSEN